MKAPHKYIQWAILTVLFGIGFFAFLILAGNENPEHPMSIADWFAIKIAAGAALYACVLLGKYLYRLGILPVLDEDMEKEEEDFYE